MSSRHHYVAQFHLRGFLDPAAVGVPNPWLWLGGCADGEVRRRSPRNMGWERALYDVPGAFLAGDARLERYLAGRVEAPAASALRAFASQRPGSRSELPPALMRYVAWAAARTPAVRTLFQHWIDEFGHQERPFAEPPPEWFENMSERSGLHRMEHAIHGVRDDVAADDMAALLAAGWRFIVTSHDFGEMMHVQAAYFADRFFPRLQWLILDAPNGEHFVVGDRPVVWAAGGDLASPPFKLRASDAQLVAPLTCALALAAYHPDGVAPDGIAVRTVNQMVARAAHEWIAGPTQESVLLALSQRTPVTNRLAI